MLILSRNARQSIWLDDDIEIVVLSIGERHVKIGIQAPPEVVIRRSELRDRDIANDDSEGG